MAEITADHIVRHLENTGFVVMKKWPALGTGSSPGKREFEDWSIRIDQAVLGVQGRLVFRRAFARTMSFRTIAVKATFAGFPVSMRCPYLASMSGLRRAATRAGM